MIHHISIPAQNPLHVAEVLAEIWHAKVAPFPPHPGSYVVCPGDEYGSMIEIYPLGTKLMPGYDDEQAIFAQHTPISGFTAIHAAISVPASQEQIEQIGIREGWRVLPCNRDSFFNVIEFWVENTLMLELLPPAFTRQYLMFMQPQNLEQFFAPATAAR